MKTINIFKTLLLGAALAFAAAGCVKESADSHPNLKPLVFSPSELDFGSSQTTLSVNVSSTSKRTFHFTVETPQKDTWISVDRTESAAETSSETFNVTVDRAGLPAGNFNTSITVKAEGTAYAVPVKMSVAAPEGSGKLELRVADYMGFGIVIKKAKVTANGGEVIGDGSSMTLDLGAGIEIKNVLKIDETPSIDFSIPQGDYSQGFTFELTDAQNRVFTLATSAKVTLPKDETVKIATAPLTTYFGKANTVMASTAGNVEIDITPYYTLSETYVHEGKQIMCADGSAYAPVAKAEILWQQGIKGGSNEIVGTPAISGNKLTVPVKGNKGNAVVVIKDAAGTTLWAYQVWVSDVQDVEFSSSYGTSYFIQNYNLGATCITPKDQDAYGCCYQWGRSVPFPRAKDVERPDASSGTSPYDGCGITDALTVDATTGIIAYAIQHPGTRMIHGTDWLVNGRNNALWGNGKTTGVGDGLKGVRTVYDPCPEGYRIPEYAAFADCAKEGTFNDNYGWYLATGAGDNKVFIPAAGMLATNVQQYKYFEYNGYYWTTNAGGTGVNCLTVTPTDKKASGVNRSGAIAVRCMKITEK